MNNRVLIWAGVAIVGLFAVGYVFRKTEQAAGAINPVSDQNIFYRGANAVLQVFTETGDTLGTWLYNVTHPGAGAQITGTPPASNTAPTSPSTDPAANVYY
jgi:hypothetical protein